MKLRFTPRATTDLDEIAEYIRERNPSAALRVRTAILGLLRRVVDFPDSGRRQSLEGVRKVVTPRYPYLIYYTVDRLAGEVVVLTIQHAARERDNADR